MDHKYFASLAGVVALVDDSNERERMARLIGAICADRKNFDWFLWNRMCQIWEPVEHYCGSRERALVHDAKEGMVIWVDKDVVCAFCDQRAVIEEVSGGHITIRLSGNNKQWGIRPQHIVGIEINEHLTIRFKYAGHQTTETYCRSCGE